LWPVRGRATSPVTPSPYPSAMAGDDVPQGTRFVWQQAEGRLEAQMRQADSLDTKAAGLVGIHALAAGLAATIVGELRGFSRWLAVASILVLLASGGLALLAFRSEPYDRSPAPQELWRFGEWLEDEIRYRFLSTRLRAIKANRLRLDAKGRRLTGSLIGLAVVASMVAIATTVGLVRA
jgi:hypothetical protein